MGARDGGYVYSWERVAARKESLDNDRGWLFVLPCLTAFDLHGAHSCARSGDAIGFAVLGVAAVAAALLWLRTAR